MINENEVIDKLADYFLSKYDCTVDKRYTHQTGIDLKILKANGERIYIEAKGETSSIEGTPNFGFPFKPRQIWTHVSVGLLKTILDMSKPEYAGARFGLAFPDNHEMLVERVRAGIEKMEIDVYFVSHEGVRKF